MAKQSSPLSFRIDPGLRASLEAAARRDRRSLSSLVTIILTDWANANGETIQARPAPEQVERPPRAYRALPGRPRKLPDADNDWLDRQIKSKLNPQLDYDLETISVEVTSKDIASHVQHFDKALSNALLRTGWIQAIATATGDRVWLTRERLEQAQT